MKKLLLLCMMVATSLAQTTVYENDFSSGGLQPNFDTSITSGNPTAGRYLGKFSGATRQSTTLTLTNLPPHQYITVSFDVIIAMTWDGNGRGYIDTNNLSAYIPDNGPDIFKVTADDNTMVHTTFASHDLEFYRFQSYPGTFPQDAYRPGTGAVCTNCCGANWNLDWYWVAFPNDKPLPDSILLKDALYHFDVTYTNSSDITTVVFKTFTLSSGTYQGDYDEWWGLDNVKVQVSDEAITPLTVCVPQVVQDIVPKTVSLASLYVVGEAGTDMEIQSSVDLTTWVNERLVNFTGFYESNVSLLPPPAPQGSNLAAAPANRSLKIWRVVQTKKKH